MKLTMVLLLGISAFLSCGCAAQRSALTNEQIVAEYKYCAANGMNADLIYRDYLGGDEAVVSVVCTPPKEY